MTEFEKLLRDDLHAAADSVDVRVSPDAAAADHARLTGRTAWTRWVAAALALVVVAAVAWWAWPLLDRRPDSAVPNPLQTPSGSVAPTVEPTPGPSTPSPAEASAPASIAPSATPAGAGPSASGAAGRTVGMWVYFVSQDSLAMVREWHEVPAATPARGALEAMLAGGEDPDYASVWPTDTRVLGIAQRGDVITVDLSAGANRLNTGAAVEATAINALVYTVTEAFSAGDRVLLTVDGQPFETGHNAWTEPLSRVADPHQHPMLMVVDAPTQGATVGNPVRVTGMAAAFEATIGWKVTRPDGTVVAEAWTQTEEGMVLAPFAFDLPPLEPGDYTVTVTVDDPTGGEGPPPASDDKDFTVR